MPSKELRITIDDDSVVAALRRLARIDRDMSPLSRRIAATLEDTIVESFAREASPAGSWAPLAERTVRQRGSARPILQHTRQLRHSVASDHGRTWAVAGVQKASHGRNIARYLNEGTSRMPARPFLALWPAHRREIVDDVSAFVRDAWRGR